MSFNFPHKYEQWSTAFEYLAQHGCTKQLADLIDGKGVIPRQARKLLAQYLRGELTVRDTDHQNRKLSASERDELQTRLWFVSDNCSRLLSLSSEISDKLGREPREVVDYAYRVKQMGIEALEKKFEVSRRTVTDFVSSRESKRWSDAISGKQDYKFHSKNEIEKEKLVYDTLDAALEQELKEALVTLRFPYVYLNPLSPEALLPGAFDPDYLNGPVSVPFYPDGPKAPLINGRTLEGIVRSSGWWSCPDLDPKLSESEMGMFYNSHWDFTKI